MPRNMRFGPSNASSIDLCVRDLIIESRYRDTTTVICCENETLFPDIDVTTYKPHVDAHKRRKVEFAVEQAKKIAADIIVVQQHLPTAAALARRVSIPVILHKHNMTKARPKGSLLDDVRRLWRLRQYNRLAGIIFVSHACRDAFHDDWPEVTTPSTVVYNGLDFSEWQPTLLRANEIICVGRATPEKGIKEAADAVASVLREREDWRARFILSEAERFPGYVDEILASIRPVNKRVTVEFNQPYSVVRQRVLSAAIAVIPSKWEEPFGRTALEAHAGGCAVVSSGTGGLSEISGDSALMLPRGFGASAIVDRLKTLISDKALRKKLADGGRKYCEKQFSLNVVSSFADGFYDRVANKNANALWDVLNRTTTRQSQPGAAVAEDAPASSILALHGRNVAD